MCRYVRANWRPNQDRVKEGRKTANGHVKKGAFSIDSMLSLVFSAHI